MLDFNLLGPLKPRRFTRAEYHQLIGRGFFDDERVELLHGFVVEMSPSDPSHAGPVQWLTKTFVRLLIGRAEVRVQLSFIAADDSEPEPDIAIVPPGDYYDEHPRAAHLIIEVADSSLRKDRKIKAPLYAASQVAEYWIVNVAENVVETHRDPADGAYRKVTSHGRDETLHPEAFPDIAIRIADLIR